MFGSQPLREAVSWNKICLKKAEPNQVSLFVRLWVEIFRIFETDCMVKSASSWGCELKCVILPSRINVTWSASSWGCELKYAFRSSVFIRNKSASSWGCELKCNREICMRISRFVSLFVRLWIEIKWQDETVETVLRQPLRETVRWNFCKKCNRIYFFASFFIRLWVGRKQR